MPPPPPEWTGPLDARRLLEVLAEETEVAIFVKDRQGRYRMVNRHTAELWGLSRDEVLGKTDHDLFPPEVAERLHANDLRVMETGEAIQVEEVTHFGAEPRFYVSSKVPLTGPSGEVEGICGIATDITSIKRAEEALRESEERFRSLADAAPVLIWVSGPDKQGVFFNETWLEFTGKTLEEQAGDQWLEGVHPDDRPALDECARAFDARRPFRTQFRLRRHDGEYRWMLDTGVPRTHPDGGFAGFIGSCIDISHQVELQETLRRQAELLVEAHQRKDEFLAMLGHELRNPMAPLRHVIGLFQRRRHDFDPELREAITIADRQLAHLKRLVDDLLDMARISRGRIELDRRPLPLERAVRSALETLRPLLAKRSLQCELSVAGQPVVDGDETRIAQVVGNLLHNAAKYTPSGGRVEVRVREEGAEALVEVVDTGIGIPRERLEDVFELFHQREQSLERSEGGLGLGLALVRRLVEMHGGRVSAASEGEGRGSTFQIRLPTVGDVGDGAEAEEAEVAAASPPRRRRILVVDDNTDATDSLATLLELDGHEIARAYDGEEALAVVERFSPDVVLLDIGLPLVDGYEVARRIRTGGRSSTLLVALTGYGQQSAVERTREVGFDHHLLKPVDLSALQSILAGPRRGP